MTAADTVTAPSRQRRGNSSSTATRRPSGLVVHFLIRFSCMSQPLTADDLLPLIVKLSSAERRKLFLLIQKVGSDVEAYRAVPPAQDEFSSDEDMLAWDADGWEDVKGNEARFAGTLSNSPTSDAQSCSSPGTKSLTSSMSLSSFQLRGRFAV